MNRSGFTTSRLKTLDANHLNFPCIYKDGHMMTIWHSYASGKLWIKKTATTITMVLLEHMFSPYIYATLVFYSLDNIMHKNILKPKL